MYPIAPRSLRLHGMTRQYVCTPCGQLAGPIRRKGRVLIQGCSCTPGTPWPWPSGDLAQAAELCACCGQVLFGATTRWSLFFCPSCVSRVKGLNSRAGRYVIPIGRHSLHNGWVVPRASASPRSEVERLLFLQQWEAVGSAMSALRNWRCTVVKRVVAERWGEAPERIPIAEYLERCDASPEEGARRFEEMLEYLSALGKRGS